MTPIRRGPQTAATIAFQSPRQDGHTRLFLMNADGSHQRALTQNTGFCGVPVWSPDGKRIAYQCTEDAQRTGTGKPWQLFVIDVDGGKAAAILADQFERPGAQLVS